MSRRRKPGPSGKKTAAARRHGSASRASASASARRSPQLTAKKAAPKTLPKSKARAGENSAVVAFPADCTIAQAGEVKASLARLISKTTPVTLDLSQVRRVDTAALQVFTAFIRERRAAGRGVDFKGTSEAFLVTADVLGLRALFSPVMDDRLAAPAAGRA